MISTNGWFVRKKSYLVLWFKVGRNIAIFNSAENDAFMVSDFSMVSELNWALESASNC